MEQTKTADGLPHEKKDCEKEYEDKAYEDKDCGNCACAYYGEMPRLDGILRDARFRDNLARIEKLEEQRVFCRHGLEHLLAVARIAWILTLEERLPFSKEILYSAALLHDLGRFRQYETQEPHHEAGAALAEEILRDAGYDAAEVAEIAAAIRQHGDEAQCRSELARLLYRADKLSRNCFCCAAQADCKWSGERRNKTIRC